MSYVLIVGAKSDIAKAVARKYSENGYNLYLAAREHEELTAFANDISLRSSNTVKLFELDVCNLEEHVEFYDKLPERPVGTIICVGYMADQEIAQAELDETLKTINTNFTGCVSLLNIIANDYEKHRNGFIVAVSSVAGDRGRKTNYLYGSAKAGLTAYLSGLRNRLNNSNVPVLTVKPGFVNTRMTQDMDLPEKLTAQPDEVASAIYKYQQKRKNILYTKGIWRIIMFIIRHIPESIFKRLSI
ncbi:SDR family oxidoreductase [Limisalsivibrio acetivorans]|uniref:SDR family oxidoreductase n=1 Tax=Limisalsivibrio acetivorans TaxID=1304888 RepID=UPI0003B357F7|nr:SDR family oxidoreductase [Limisalsivibrio acetivorans]